MQVVSSDGTPLVRPRVAPVADAFAAAEFGAPRLVGNAARLVADRWPGDLIQPESVAQQAAPDITWVTWLGVAANPAASKPRPLYLRPVDAKPQVTPALDQPAQPASP
jgi:tRNA threonylcarbamoyladenosine biosynthesis protein TsaB